MDWSQSVLLLLSLLFAEITCSGFLHIRLKSQYLQEAKLIVGPKSRSSPIAARIRLHPGTTRELGPFPIEFNEKYTMTINGGGVGELGINGSTHTAEFEPTRGTLSPKHLHLPLNGLELIFECDEQWSGSKCDVRCSNDCTTDRVNETMTVSTDYSIDMTKLPEIVKRLKETTEVENDIGREEKKRVVENQKDVLGASKPRKSPISLFQDLFSNLLGPKVSIVDKSTDENPVHVEVQSKQTDNGWGDFRMTGKYTGPLKNDDEESKIEKHSTLQKTFSFGHTKPSRFGGLDGPAKGMLSLFQPLMGLIPRGSSGGKSSDDFILDQIFRN